MNAQFLTPVITVFDKQGNLDADGNRGVYEHLIAGGIDGIVVMGSTGEFFNMTLDTQKQLIDIATSCINKRTRVLIGTSRMIAEETIELCNYAVEKGADGVMVISPYYFALNDKSIESYYDKIAEGTKANIYLYNFPDRTGYDLSPALTLRLVRKHKNIVGYKDTVTVMGHTRDLINTIKPEFPDFEIYSGYDDNFAHNIMSGGSGCIGGLSNLIPEICSDWARAFDNNDFEKIKKLQKYIDKAMSIYSICSPFIPAMKKAMKLKGVDISDYVAVPFISADDEQTERIKKLMKELEII